jgi:photosystem II stability/assembly factor-like uncharacterized protein
MAGELILATRQGVVISEMKGTGWQMVRRGLDTEVVTSVIAREGVVLAGTRRGIFRSDDLGRTWMPAADGMGEAHIRWLAFHPAISDFELAGTEPAGIFISKDGAKSWQGSSQVEHLRHAHEWYLPYSPEAGCVRGFAVSGSRIYAAVEVGGVLRSDDYGENWRLANGENGSTGAAVNQDVHSIVVHPEDANRVYTPTGGGFYTSPDGGQSWRSLVSHCYCRAIWLDPENPARILLGFAQGVDRNGCINLSEDGGQSWQPASDGLQVPWPRHMVERFTQVGSRLLAVLSNGDLIQAEIRPAPHTWSWRSVLEELNDIQSVTEMY